jgi:crotonobetainyl-CoA:carnitine CoA-transferase CaiB-like acyl-CoA transferase
MTESQSPVLVELPLAGVRVLDFTRFLAGPYAAWILACLGAEVVKVEDPDRPDEARKVGPYFQGEQSLYFAALNTGKKSLAARIRTPSGRELLLELSKSVDVILDNNRPGAMESLGLGPVDFQRANPQIVTVSLSGFGDFGPLSDNPGYDYTIQALSGVMSMTGEPDGPPGKAGISYVDHSGGLAAALATCAALLGKVRTGRGGHVPLSLYDVQMSMLTYLAAWQLNAGYEGGRTPSASHPSIVPAQTFPSADGHVSIFVGNDTMWVRLCDVVGDPFLARPEFSENSGRLRHRDELVAHLTQCLSEQTTAHWVALLKSGGVPCAAVSSLSEALTEPHLRARGLVGSATHPQYGEYSYIGGPLPGMQQGDLLPAPLLGEHSRSVLSGLGFASAHIDDLLRAGTILDTTERADSTAP